MSISAANELAGEGWQAYANCSDTNPKLFYGENGMDSGKAKKICRGCVVREDCLEYALAFPEHFGIWGGMSERERRRVLKRRRQAASRT